MTPRIRRQILQPEDISQAPYHKPSLVHGKGTHNLCQQPYFPKDVREEMPSYSSLKDKALGKVPGQCHPNEAKR